MTLPAALLFDFDGLILDTETCSYDSVCAIFAEHGVTVDLAWWHSILGNGGHPHWSEMLAEQIGRPVDREALSARREAERLPILHALPPCDGVVELLDAAAAAGVPAAVASSSPADWVEGHLVRLGLRDRFDAGITRDDVGGDGARTKPEPDLFLLAADALDAAPPDCVVLEDSPNGVAAGRAAGMAVVAVPGPMTAPLDFSAAHLVVASLLEVDLEVVGALLAT